MAQEIFNKYVTSSVGNLYKGALIKDTGEYRIYVCIKRGKENVIGFCACDSQGVFGPLCSDVYNALYRAQNVSRALKRRTAEKHR